MKVASSIIVAVALVLASAPAFAHGGGMGMGGMGGMGSMGHNMGRMGHGNGMTVNTQTHDWNFTKINKTNNGKTDFSKKNFFRRRLEFVRIQREILRLDREIVRLIRHGQGHSPLVKVLEFQKSRLLLQQHIS